MSARVPPRTLVLRPSAKINLTLRVGPRRADGFHDVRTLLQSIDLHDTMRLTSRAGPFALVSRSIGIPLDRTNLIWRAADLLWRALGRTGDAGDAQVTVEKAIPPAAGLGGGSADAAAALVGLNKLWKGKLGRRELIQLAAELGSDVPFFLHGGTTFGAGRGEELYPVDDIAPLSLVIMKPSFGVSTGDAYGWLDEDRQKGVTSEPRAREIDVGWPTGPLALVNDLEPPVARRHRKIAAAIEALSREGASAAAMSGSGSAIFGAFSSKSVKSVVERLQRPGWLVLPVRTLSRRAAVRRMGL